MSSRRGSHVCFRSPKPKAHRWAYGVGMPPSYGIVNIFKHLLLWSHFANWSLISYGASMGLGKESLFKGSWSHDQDGHHAHIVKTIKNLILRNQMAEIIETWYTALATQVLPSLFKWWRQVDLWPFYATVKFGSLCFYMGKRLNNRFLGNYSSLWCKSWYVL